MDGDLDKGDRIQIENGITIEVLYTPGHSDDSVSFYIPEEKVLIVGDAVPVPGDLPIYNSYLETKRTLNKLKEIDFNFLLMSWCDVKDRVEGLKAIEEGLQYLERINSIVHEVSGEEVPENVMNFCAEVVKKLCLPKTAVNPLVVRSLLAHYEQ